MWEKIRKYSSTYRTIDSLFQFSFFLHCFPSVHATAYLKIEYYIQSELSDFVCRFFKKTRNILFKNVFSSLTYQYPLVAHFTATGVKIFASVYWPMSFPFWIWKKWPVAGSGHPASGQGKIWAKFYELTVFFCLSGPFWNTVVCKNVVK